MANPDNSPSSQSSGAGDEGNGSFGTGSQSSADSGSRKGYVDDNGKEYAVKGRDNTYELKPDNEYTVSGYTYTTDSAGRISSVSGTLRLSEEGRKALNAVVPDMEKGDERGHLIADMFDGSNKVGNLVAMGFDVNRRSYKRLEERWASYIDKGAEVKVDVQPKYDDDSSRPGAFMIIYTINGKRFGHLMSNRRKKAA